MFGAQRQRLIERFLPLTHGLLRQTKHEIQVDRGETDGARVGYGLRDLFRRVDAAQRLQQRRVETLRSHAQTVDARRAQPGQLRLAQRAGIGFQCHLGSLVNGEVGATGGEDALHLGTAQQTGRAAAKKDGAAAALLSIGTASELARQRDLGNQGARIGFAQRQQASVGVEIAIVAARVAKGNVQVKRCCV